MSGSKDKSLTQFVSATATRVWPRRFRWKQKRIWARSWAHDCLRTCLGKILKSENACCFPIIGSAPGMPRFSPHNDIWGRRNDRSSTHRPYSSHSLRSTSSSQQHVHQRSRHLSRRGLLLALLNAAFMTKLYCVEKRREARQTACENRPHCTHSTALRRRPSTNVDPNCLRTSGQ